MFSDWHREKTDLVGGGSGCFPTGIEKKTDLVGGGSGCFPTNIEKKLVWSD